MGKFIEWLESDSVGVEAIDKDHKQLVLLANELVKTAFEGEQEDKENLLVQGLSELIMFAENHFAREEAFLKRMASPNLESHKQQHQKIVDDLFAMNDQLRKGELDIVAISTFLMDWWYTHMRGADHDDLAAKPKASTG